MVAKQISLLLFSPASHSSSAPQWNELLIYHTVTPEKYFFELVSVFFSFNTVFFRKTPQGAFETENMLFLPP